MQSLSKYLQDKICNHTECRTLNKAKLSTLSFSYVLRQHPVLRQIFSRDGQDPVKEKHEDKTDRKMFVLYKHQIIVNQNK